MIRYLNSATCILLVFLAVTLGCSSSPTSAQAANQVSQAACARSKDCAGDAFAVQFPGGVNECVDGFRKKSGASDSTVSTCSQGDIDACVKDINNVTCDAVTTSSGFPTPASCSKC